MKSLVLSHNEIGNAGVKQIFQNLRDNGALTHISLDQNKIGDEGATAIASELKTMQQLKTLSLCDNNIGDGGIKALANALKKNKSLTELRLKGNKIDQHAVDYLADGLKSNREMKIIQLCGDVDVSQFREEKTKCLDLSFKKYQDVDAKLIASFFQGNATLTKINLSGNCIATSGAEAIFVGLQTNKTITEINLIHNEIGDFGADAVMNAILVNATLKKLYLGDNHIGNTGVRRIGEGLKKNYGVVDLDLSNNNISSDGAVKISENLKSNTVLEWLNLSGNDICDSGIIAIMDIWMINKTLKHIDLSQTKIGNSGAKVITDGMMKYNILTSLNISNNPGIGDTNSELLAESIIKCKTIQKLSGISVCDMQGNNLDFKELMLMEIGCGKTEAIVLGSLLKDNITLTKLSIDIKHVDDLKAIISGLEKNTTLTELRLNGNEISDQSTIVLAQGLTKNCGIKSLIMNGNVPIEKFRDGKTKNIELSFRKYRDTDTIIIAKFLSRNSILTKLSLLGNRISDVGVKAIVNELKGNLILEELNLSQNKIGENGAQAIAELLLKNSKLNTLLIYSNMVGDKGVQSLVNALKSNNTLKELYIGDNDIGETGINSIKQQKNTTCDIHYEDINLEGVKQWLCSLELGDHLKTFEEEEYYPMSLIKGLNKNQIQEMIKEVKCKDSEIVKIKKSLHILQNVAGVRAGEVIKLIHAETKHPVYLKGLKRQDELEKVLSLRKSGHVDDITWTKMNSILRQSMEDQLIHSKFSFNKKIHRFPDTYPYEFNTMPNYIGSWMGDCFGMMQWPMPQPHYMKCLQQIITENNVGMIVALGEQNKGERIPMVSYWETLGTAYREKVYEGFIIRMVTGIPPHNASCIALQFPSWRDYDSPNKHKFCFDALFNRIKQVENARKRILLHCRAGCGRSGTLRLMYKAWKKELYPKDLLSALNTQRALRMWTIQTRAQYNFLYDYIRTVSLLPLELDI